VDVSVSSFDSYTPTRRHTLDLVTCAAEYLSVIKMRLEALDRAAPRFGLCLYNAGMDPLERSGIGGLEGITSSILRERERLVFNWCSRQRISVAFVLAGGYVGPELDQAGLVEVHRATIEEAVVIQ
jgi:acetoin utilization deacetylase AcuC-like enzyme